MTYHRKAEICPPAIRLKSISSLYFDFDGKSYPLAAAPTEIFKKAVREKHPTPFGHVATEQLMEQDILDTVSRWFLANELVSLKCPLQIWGLKKSLV